LRKFGAELTESAKPQRRWEAAPAAGDNGDSATRYLSPSPLFQQLELLRARSPRLSPGRALGDRPSRQTLEVGDEAGISKRASASRRRPKRPESSVVRIVPEMEKRRAWLDATVRLWIILDEYIVGQSFYLEPEPPLGRFSKAFFLPLMKEFISRRAGARGVNRRR
jgi:hypothetical protein